MFARRNLPSLDDVPCSSLASVTDSFKSWVVPTALAFILAPVTASTRLRGLEFGMEQVGCNVEIVL